MKLAWNFPDNDIYLVLHTQQLQWRVWWSVQIISFDMYSMYYVWISEPLQGKELWTLRARKNWTHLWPRRPRGRVIAPQRYWTGCCFFTCTFILDVHEQLKFNFPFRKKCICFHCVSVGPSSSPMSSSNLSHG